MELDDLARKYGLDTLEERTNFLQPSTEEQTKQVNTTWYKDFLKVTDEGIIEAFETLFSEPSKFLTNIISLSKTYADLLKWRAYARTQLAKEMK